MPSPTLTDTLLGLVDATAGDYKTLSADNDVWTLNRVLKLTEGAGHIIGEEAGDAILHLSADQADDNSDQWRFRVQDGGTLTLETFATGAWVVVAQWSTGGSLLKPIHPVFSVTNAGAQSNIAPGSDITVVFDTELIDLRGDFASNTFTAPVAGQYFFTAQIPLTTLDTGADWYRIRLVTTQNILVHTTDPLYTADLDQFFMGLSGVFTMAASDTALVTFRQEGGTQQTDVTSPAQFSGFLVG